MPSDEHADTFVAVEPTTTTTTSPTGTSQTKAVDNAQQALHAERERTFTTGGDGPAPGTPAAEPIAPPSWIAVATARIRQPERPSPFGLAWFPPLPTPPERAG